MPSCTQILSTVVGLAPGEPALTVPPGLAERNVVVVEPERALSIPLRNPEPGACSFIFELQIEFKLFFLGRNFGQHEPSCRRRARLLVHLPHCFIFSLCFSTSDAIIIHGLVVSASA
jgi:hypothetical protein